MTFKIGDKVRLAPHVTDEMLESIYIEDDSEKENARAASVVETVDCDESFDGRICDVDLGDFYVPSSWLVLADKPRPLDAATLTRILAELRAPCPGHEDMIATARSCLDCVLEEMAR